MYDISPIHHLFVVYSLSAIGWNRWVRSKFAKPRLNLWRSFGYDSRQMCNGLLDYVFGAFLPKVDAAVSSSVLQGGKSHKFIEADANSLLRFYYNSRNFLTFMCIGNELFYLMLYLLAFGQGPSLDFFGINIGLWMSLAILSFPISLFKNIVNSIQLMAAFSNIATADASARRA